MSRTLGPPMTLASMRANGVRLVIATCEACGHKADVNVDGLTETIGVPQTGGGLRCKAMRRQTDRYETGLAYSERSLQHRAALTHQAGVGWPRARATTASNTFRASVKPVSVGLTDPTVTKSA